MGNFSIALSGLQADSVALNTIGNNLANLNTTAFKGQTTAFEDLFYQQIGESGSGDAIQLGAGTRVSGTSTNFTQGTILPDCKREFVRHGPGWQWVLCRAAGRGAIADSRGQLSAELKRQFDYAGWATGDGISRCEWRRESELQPGADHDTGWPE